MYSIYGCALDTMNVARLERRRVAGGHQRQREEAAPGGGRRHDADQGAAAAQGEEAHPQVSSKSESNAETLSLVSLHFVVMCTGLSTGVSARLCELVPNIVASLY